MKTTRIYILFLSFACAFTGTAQTKKKIDYFDLHAVRLLDSPFKHAQDLDKVYLLELNADRLLAPFLREAGLPQKAESYTNWENTGLDGHIGGHYLSALSLMYASTDDKEIGERLNYMLSELKRCQEANGNGYIGGVPDGKKIWEEIANGNIRAAGFSLNDKWVPLYNIHKTYAGLRDAYLYAGRQDAKEMLIKMSDWAIRLVENLSDTQMQDMLRSEHGGLNEVFADVAAITGDKKYLKLAHLFSHQFVLEPLLSHEDKLTGMHANTQIPKVLGFKRIADIEGNESWSDASRFFWETVVEHRSVCIGGNSVREHFHPTNDFSGMVKEIEGPETCNTYNMLRLSKMLYQTSLDKKYMDYYERALYNHILSTQNPETGGLVYFTQMRPGHYRVYSQPQTSMWCCVGSGIENHAKYGEMIYAHGVDELYVNLFIPSTLYWEDKKVEVTQNNSFPDQASTELSFNTERPTKFTLKIRYPSWVEANNVEVFINGKGIRINQTDDGYISIDRKWVMGDKVVIQMPMHIVVEQLPDQTNYYSILYGPLVLAAKTEKDDLAGLFADDSRGGHIAHGKKIPLRDMPIIVSDPDKISSCIQPVTGKPLTFTLSNLYSHKYPNEMELIPFFRLHESRYIIYWPQATTEDVAKLQERIMIEEKENERLDTITLDKITCGEQQPESDHFIQSDKSRTGFDEGVHWRDAQGWFGYQLKNVNNDAKYVFLKYLDLQEPSAFDIILNDSIIASVTLDGTGGEETFSQVIEIPSSLSDSDKLSIKIQAKDDRKTAKIVEIRLLSKK